MSKLLIGIACRTMMHNSLYRLQLNANYVEPFTDRLVSTVIITNNDPDLLGTLQLCDGFLLPGGDDINPEYYGEENKGLSKEIDYSLDELDRKIISYAVKNQRPILGICRGIQSLAAFCGGTLYQDIKEAGLKHDVKENCHVVNTLYNHPFAKEFNETFVTNSFHHQAVKDVPEGFQVIFKHQDVIEGIIHTSLPILGVQWHPERIATRESKLIFDQFVAWVKEAHEKR